LIGLSNRGSANATEPNGHIRSRSRAENLARRTVSPTRRSDPYAWAKRKSRCSWGQRLSHDCERNMRGYHAMIRKNNTIIDCVAPKRSSGAKDRRRWRGNL
jgi:hypothetical protein